MAVGFLLTSFLVFLFGVYVGKEVEAHKAAQQTRTMRLPASASAEPQNSRPTAADLTGRVHSTPAEKPVTIPPAPNSIASAVLLPEPQLPARPTEASAPPASSSATNQLAAGGQSKLSPSSAPLPPPSVASSTPPLPAAPSAPGVSVSSTSKASVVPKPLPQTPSSKSPSVASPAPKPQPSSSSNVGTAVPESPKEPPSVPLGHRTWQNNCMSKVSRRLSARSNGREKCGTG